MRNIICISVFIIMFYLPISAQMSIEGITLSASDSTALPYAHVTIMGKPVGTCSNHNGEFVFNFDSTVQQSDTLAFSFMGFKTYTCAVHSLDTSLHKIYLAEQEYELGEVVILEPGELGRIVKRSIKRVNKNYYQRPYQAEGFYRNISVTQDSTIAYLEEAAFVENRSNFSSLTDDDHLYIREIRRSNQLYDLRFMKKIYDKINPSNNLHITKKFGEIIRNHYTAEFMNTSIFSLNRIIHTDSSKIYKIEFETINPYGSQPEAYTGGVIYINDYDWAVIRIEYGHILREKKNEYQKKQFNSVYQKKYFLYSITDYRKIHKDKYGIISTMRIGNVFNKNDKYSIYKLEWIVYTNINMQKRHYINTDNFHEVAFTTLMKKVQMPYNPIFWQTYNYPKLEQYKNGITYLEKEKPLEQQFMENGAK